MISQGKARNGWPPCTRPRKSLPVKHASVAWWILRHHATVCTRDPADGEAGPARWILGRFGNKRGAGRTARERPAQTELNSEGSARDYLHGRVARRELRFWRKGSDPCGGREA